MTASTCSQVHRLKLNLSILCSSFEYGRSGLEQCRPNVHYEAQIREQQPRDAVHNNGSKETVCKAFSMRNKHLKDEMRMRRGLVVFLSQFVLQHNAAQCGCDLLHRFNSLYAEHSSNNIGQSKPMIGLCAHDVPLDCRSYPVRRSDKASMQDHQSRQVPRVYLSAQTGLRGAWHMGNSREQPAADMRKANCQAGMANRTSCVSYGHSDFRNVPPIVYECEVLRRYR